MPNEYRPFLKTVLKMFLEKTDLMGAAPSSLLGTEKDQDSRRSKLPLGLSFHSGCLSFAALGIRILNP